MGTAGPGVGANEATLIDILSSASASWLDPPHWPFDAGGDRAPLEVDEHPRDGTGEGRARVGEAGTEGGGPSPPAPPGSYNE
eukprot:5005989-Alexandrium_andersonii.AAC.1